MKAVLYPIPVEAAGKLAIVARPRGGDWLEDEVRALREAGITVLVSMLTAEEGEELGLQAERLGVSCIQSCSSIFQLRTEAYRRRQNRLCVQWIDWCHELGEVAL